MNPPEQWPKRPSPRQLGLLLKFLTDIKWHSCFRKAERDSRYCNAAIEQNLVKQLSQISNAKSQHPQVFWCLWNHKEEKGIYLAPTARVCMRGKRPARNIPDPANKKSSVFWGQISLDPKKAILFNQSRGYSKILRFLHSWKSISNSAFSASDGTWPIPSGATFYSKTKLWTKKIEHRHYPLRITLTGKWKASSQI